jgi:[ribulose-bisphosphate carboxylase]-lysine N-methyltransferase
MIVRNCVISLVLFSRLVLSAFLPVNPVSSFGGLPSLSTVYSRLFVTPLTQDTSSINSDLEWMCNSLNSALEKCTPDLIKTCKVKVGISPSGYRLGLFSKTLESIKEGELLLGIPYDDQLALTLTPTMAVQQVYKGVLPQGYNGWTGDVGLIALLVLNELAKSADGNHGIPLPTRKLEVTELMSAWIKSLPNLLEMSKVHPLLWDEDTQEILQSSSTNKIYRLLDDIDEDASWLQEKIWSLNRSIFPETIRLERNGNVMEFPCFSPKGFRWAYAIVSSRSVFVDGSLRLIPIMDMANHDDSAQEVSGGSMGPFGTTKGALLRFSTRGKVSSSTDTSKEIFVSYGPKTAAEYLIEHGFIPNQAKTIVSAASLTFELDSEDKFYDDKMDILEFETYDSAPMEPIQTFDIVSQLGRESEPDPSMIQFLRLVKLGGFDSFLLESVFRKQVWGFMSMPVSEKNERDVLDTIANLCSRYISELDTVSEYKKEGDSSSPLALCSTVRFVERKVLARTIEYISREKEALDLKEYYQQRRLKDLGLDSEWTPEGTSTTPSEDEMDYGQKRKPGVLDW